MHNAELRTNPVRFCGFHLQKCGLYNDDILLFVCCPWNIFSHSPCGSTLWWTGAYRINSCTLVLIRSENLN